MISEKTIRTAANSYKGRDAFDLRNKTIASLKKLGYKITEQYFYTISKNVQIIWDLRNSK